MSLFDHIQAEVEGREKREGGINPADLLDLSPVLRRLMNRISREGALSLEAAAEQLGESPAHTCQMLDTLVEKGYLLREGAEKSPTYRIRYGRRRGRELPGGIWVALVDKKEATD